MRWRIRRNISLQSGPMSSYIDLDYNASRASILFGEDRSSQLLLTTASNERHELPALLTIHHTENPMNRQMSKTNLISFLYKYRE